MALLLAVGCCQLALQTRNSFAGESGWLVSIAISEGLESAVNSSEQYISNRNMAALLLSAASKLSHPCASANTPVIRPDEMPATHKPSHTAVNATETKAGFQKINERISELKYAHLHEILSAEMTYGATSSFCFHCV